MRYVVHAKGNLDGAAFQCVREENYERKAVHLIEDCLRRVTADDADVMFSLFSRVVRQHAVSSQEPLARLEMQQTLDEILMMISLEMYGANSEERKPGSSPKSSVQHA